MGVSELPVSPTESLYCEYLIAIAKFILVPDIAIAEIQSLPLSSLSATLKNL